MIYTHDSAGKRAYVTYARFCGDRVEHIGFSYKRAEGREFDARRTRLVRAAIRASRRVMGPTTSLPEAAAEDA